MFQITHAMSIQITMSTIVHAEHEHCLCTGYNKAGLVNLDSTAMLLILVTCPLI